MDVSGRVRMKSDRRTRALIVALCIAPVATPLLAAGLNSIVKSYAAPAPAVAQANEPALTLRPSLLATVEDPFLSPKRMGGSARLEQGPPAKSQQIFARPRIAGAHVLREVTIVDGLQIAAEGMVIGLAGVAPVPTGSECRRLDGVVEPCALRAASRLEILTRGRPVVCDLQEDEKGDLRGVCRAGKIDLADDLVRNGLAVRTSDRL